MLSLLLLVSQTKPLELRLQDVNLSHMDQGWGKPTAGKSVDRNPLRIKGRAFAHGIGTHAYSEITIDLGGRAKSFHSWVGLDEEVKELGSVRFEVYVDGRKWADSGVMRGGEAAKELKVDLTGAKHLTLLVDEADNGIDHDHADWAEAVIVYTGKAPAAISKPNEPVQIAKIDPNEPGIHGPRVAGCTPGKPFLFKIPATGTDSTTVFRVENLPPGLSLDRKTGIIQGRILRQGEYLTRVSFKGRKQAKRDLKIVCGPNKLALTPPMGWNSWNVWGTAVDADKVRAATDAFIQQGLANYGYSYVNIDDAWEGVRSANGEIQTNQKFGDMGALADYVHSLGLKLGIYSSPGPKTCANYEGSYMHEQQDAHTYAKWGIDYLKHDWCSYGQLVPRPTLDQMKEPYVKMKAALDSSERDIVFSLCQYGMGDVYKWGKEVGGNLWRTTGDIFDSWSSMANIGFAHSEKSIGVTPGGWNDPDMLVVGYLGWGPNPRPTRLTQHEQVTHITLWSMLAAPLILGCDLTRLDEFTKNLITNPEVLEVDQDPKGVPATRLSQNGAIEVWTRPLHDGSYAVAFFNRGRQKESAEIKWAQLGLSGSFKIRNLWTRKDQRSSASGFSSEVAPHGAVMLRISR